MATGLSVEPLAGRDLAAFVASVEAASMQGAAEALGLTQSAISKRIQALERRAGRPLLERGRFGVRPTAVGRLLYPEAKQALSALERAAVAVSQAGEGQVHVLRLAASHTIGEFLLPNWLAGFRAGYSDPHLRIEVDVVNSPGVVSRVHAGAATIGFVEGVDVLDGLDTILMMRDELLVIVAADHRWARRAAINARELATEPYLARERDSGARAIVSAALAEHDLELHPSFEVSSIPALRRAVVGGGFTVLSRHAVGSETLDADVRAVRVAGVRFHRELRAVRLESTADDVASGHFWSWLRRSPRDEAQSASLSAARWDSA